MKKMIVGTNIEKSFGQEKVLRNVSVEIEAGEFVFRLRENYFDVCPKRYGRNRWGQCPV